MATKYDFSPFGRALHPWITKPDVKFNADGLFHVDLILDAAGEGGALMAKLKAASEKAFQDYFEDEGPRGGSKVTPGERKKWSVYYPFEELEDPQTGDPTGDISFAFKQNAKIKLRTGDIKEVSIMLVDSENNDLPESTIVGSGSIIRVMYSTRLIVMTSNKQAGVRLDFAGVQVRELKGSGGGRPGFGKVEGGFVVESAFSPEGVSTGAEPEPEY